jgi:hypothetical protein
LGGDVEPLGGEARVGHAAIQPPRASPRHIGGSTATHLTAMHSIACVGGHGLARAHEIGRRGRRVRRGTGSRKRTTSDEVTSGAVRWGPVR